MGCSMTSKSHDEFFTLIYNFGVYLNKIFFGSITKKKTFLIIFNRLQDKDEGKKNFHHTTAL